MERKLLNNEDEVLEQVMLLQGNECLYFKLDRDECNDLKYVKFKKDGLQNTVMSYINATHEMANLINFEKFVDTVAQLAIEENRLTEQMIAKYAGEKVMRYLTSPHSHHQFTIDNQNAVLGVQRNNTCTAHSHMGICTC